MPRFSAKMWFFYGLVVIVVVIFVHLGCWQLNRADEKKLMLQQKQQLAHQKPEQLSKLSEPMQYQPAQISGRFLSPLFYLDNQHYQHRFGYDIISPFRTNDGLIVLVNRGWVAGDETRRNLPEIDIPGESATIQGYAYYPSKITWRLGPQVEKKGHHRYVLEQVDIEEIRAIMSQPLADFTLRIQSNTQDGFVRAWPVVSMSPSRHIGYAIQWFAMAFCLVMMLGYFVKKQYETKSN